jgi:hypothetical protein
VTLTSAGDALHGDERAGAPVVRRRSVDRSLVRPAVVCLGIAVVSLALPATLAFDPWAWLVWGREIGHLRLDTTGGPSWKPLPVLFTTLVAPAGDLAPALWLVLVRTAGLMAFVLAYRLAARFAGAAAGVVAAGLLLLTPDGGPRFLRLMAEGHSAVASATLTLWAIDRHLAGRHAPALLLATGVALERPECWPFLVAYAAWLWRTDLVPRRLIAVALAAVPMLWFGGDWWGSSDAWHGADAAQVMSDGTAARLGLIGERVAKVVVLPAWLAAAAGVASAHRRGERLLVGLGGMALAWSALVGGMSLVLGYAALSRFLLPAAAVLCVLAGVGAVRVLERARDGSARFALAGLIVVASVPAVAIRAGSLATVADGTEYRHHLDRDLDRVLERAGGADAVLACGRVAVIQSNVPRVAMAWKLDVPLHAVARRQPTVPSVVFVRAGRRDDTRLSERAVDAGGEVTELARSTDWAVFAVACPAAVGGSDASEDAAPT